jgi:hypothetical protein
MISGACGLKPKTLKNKGVYKMKNEKTEKPATSPLQSGVTLLTRLRDGSQVRACDIRAVKVYDAEQLSGGLNIPAKIIISMDGNMGDIRIDFNSHFNAQEYAETIAAIVNGVAG